MKIILIKVLIANIYLVYSKKFKLETDKISKGDDCMEECHKMKNIWNCFCDPICVDFNDCCSLYMRGCNSFFEIQSSFPNRNRTNINNSSKGSCCQSDSNLDCFCDVKCEVNKDCCHDYKTCKGKRMGFIINSSRNRQTRLYNNVFDGHHLLPYLKKDILTPQFSTVYFKKTTSNYD
jgi:hypothetical protein